MRIAGDRKKIIIVAGPNGAGKSTFIRNFLSEQSQHFVVLNADEIRQEPEIKLNQSKQKEKCWRA